MTLAAALAAGILAGLAGAAFFAACEGAFYAMGPPEDSNGSPPPAARLLAQPDRLQHGLALGHLLALVWTAALAWEVASAWAGPRPGWVTWGVTVVAASFGMMVGGELVPKALAAEHPAAWVRRSAPWVRLWLAALTPIVAAVGAMTRAVERRVGAGPAAEPLSTEDVRSMVAETTARSGMASSQREMITSIFAFGETTVREVMTPRPDVFAVEASTPWDEVIGSVREAAHSRVPIFEGSLDRIVGVLYAKDLLPVMHGRNAPPGRWADLARAPTFVPEGHRIDDLLRQFQRERTHLAIVADEYGGMAGIVTLEDILEELVGEIQDEYDREAPRVVRRSDGSLRLDGRLDADDFNELTGSAIEVEDVETIGGIVARLLGRVPRPGEAVDLGGWRFTVESVEERRVGWVGAARTPEFTDDGAEDA